jgi:hypothetical protein
VKCDRAHGSVNDSCAPEQREKKRDEEVLPLLRHALGNDEDTEIVVTAKVGTDMRMSMKIRMIMFNLEGRCSQCRVAYRNGVLVHLFQPSGDH